MRKIFVLFCLALLITVPVMADDYDEMGMETDFADFDYMGGFQNSTGFTLGYYNLQLGDLSQQIVDLGYPQLPEGMLVYGSNSLVGFVDGIQFGFSNLSGEAKATGDDGAFSKLALQTWAGDLDYGFSIDEQLNMTAGLLLGGGTYKLSLRENLLNATASNRIELNNGFFILGPKVRLCYQVNEWFALNGDFSYIYGLGNNNWKDEKERVEVFEPATINGAVIGISAVLTY